MNEKVTDCVYKPDDTVNSLKFQISRQEKEANELRIRSFWSERRRKKKKNCERKEIKEPDEANQIHFAHVISGLNLLIKLQNVPRAIIEDIIASQIGYEVKKWPQELL